MVAGGAQVYAAALPLADEQVLTEVAPGARRRHVLPGVRPRRRVETAREAHDGFDWVWLRAGRDTAVGAGPTRTRGPQR